MLSTLRTRLTSTRTNVVAIGLTVIALFVFAAAVINLASVLRTQFETGDAALSLQLTEQGRAMTQLQREVLRLLAFVNQPVDELDFNAAELQLNLMASRFFQMSGAANLPTTRREQAEVIRDIVVQGESITPLAEEWLANPQDVALQQALIDQLTMLEQNVNQADLNSSRFRTQSVITFREATEQAQAAFTIAGVAFAFLMFTLLYTIYIYLRQAQETEAARQSLRFKDQFLAVMRHELRTPLNAIIGFLGIIKMQGTESPKSLHMIDRARVNAERLLSLIDDILDISKIEAGRFEINLEPVAVREVVNRWRTQTEVLAQQKGIDFQCIIDETIPHYLLLDEDAVSKIATNLLSNALKFTEKGTVTLEIQSLNNQWRLRVTDTGIGIAPDKQDVIFQSFRQLDSSIRRNYGGSGLGLSIVKQLATLLGGRVELESKEGVGSTFTVTLPLVVPVIAPKIESAVSSAAS